MDIDTGLDSLTYVYELAYRKSMVCELGGVSVGVLEAIHSHFKTATKLWTMPISEMPPYTDVDQTPYHRGLVTRQHQP